MSKSNKSYFHIKTSIKCKTIFLGLFNDYRNYNDQVGLDTSVFFSKGIIFLRDKYKELGISTQAPIDFKEKAFRAGKRKDHERTPWEEFRTEINFVGKIETNDNFIDVAWGFTQLNHNSIIDNPVYSKSYFFYDFINELDKYKEGFINYKKYR